jgi:probable rRNA maturation factor
MSPGVDIAVRVTSPGWRRLGACAAIARRAACAALDSAEGRAALARFAGARPAELAVLLAEDRTVRDLNRRYRGFDKPTNVLSFPATDEVPRPAQAPLMLGDVVLALETVRREAAAQGKPAADHLAHLVVHGTLHLLGYDHERAAEARRMEALETRLLAGLGIADPYRRPAPRRRAPRAAA